MATDLLTCCERLDESKYWHKCQCPSATVECESEQVDAALCGWEISGYFTPSTPPDKWTKLQITGSGGDWRVASCSDCSWQQYYYHSYKGDMSGSITYYAVDDDTPESITCDMFDGPALAARSTGSDVIVTERYDTGGTCDDCPYPLDSPTINIIHEVGGAGASNVVQGFSDWAWNNYITPDDIGTATSQFKPRNQPKDPIDFDGVIDKNDSGELWEISEKDTEQNAIDRETPTAGTSCSSLWETRSTGFSFTYRTSEYTIECVGLVVGVQYEVTPTIRKRTAVIDSYGAWEDVTVASETFTATATTKTLPAVLLGDDGNGEIIQGYEYEITGVHIEKKA